MTRLETIRDANKPDEGSGDRIGRKACDSTASVGECRYTADHTESWSGGKEKEDGPGGLGWRWPGEVIGRLGGPGILRTTCWLR